VGGCERALTRPRGPHHWGERRRILPRRETHRLRLFGQDTAAVGGGKRARTYPVRRRRRIHEPRPRPQREVHRRWGQRAYSRSTHRAGELARLRRQNGSSSEHIEREFWQREELEAAKAEAEAKVEAAAPTTPSAKDAATSPAGARQKATSRVASSSSSCGAQRSFANQHRRAPTPGCDGTLRE
jgi:hypothetical protein